MTSLAPEVFQVHGHSIAVGMNFSLGVFYILGLCSAAGCEGDFSLG